VVNVQRRGGVNPPRLLHMKKFFFFFLSWVVFSVTVARSQLTAVTFTHGYATDSNGEASETSLRNSQRALIDQLVNAHNGAWFQRSNDHRSTFLLASNAAVDIHQIRDDVNLYLETIYDTLSGSLVPLSTAIRDGVHTSTNFLNYLLVESRSLTNWMGENHKGLYTNSYYLQSINDLQMDIFNSVWHLDKMGTNALINQTNLQLVTVASTNVQTGMSNLLAAATNLLTQMTNKLQVEINLDSAMSNLLWQINNAGSWHQYIAENTKQTTNFLSLLYQQEKALTNWNSLQLQEQRALTNWSALQFATARAVSSNTWRIDFGVTNVVDRLDKLHQAALSSSNLQNLTLEVLRSNVVFNAWAMTHASNSWIAQSNSWVWQSNTVMNFSNAVANGQSLSTLIDAASTARIEQALANGNTGSNLFSGVLTKHGTIPTFTDEGRPEGVFDLDVGGYAVNADPLQHPSVGPAISVIRSFIGWLCTGALFYGIFQLVMTYIRDGAFSKTPQTKKFELNIMGNSAGAATTPFYIAVMIIIGSALPIIMLTLMSTGAGLLPGSEVVIDFVDGVLIDPFTHFSGIGGVVYLLNGFLPLSLMIICVCNFLFVWLVMAAVDFAAQISIRSLAS